MIRQALSLAAAVAMLAASPATAQSISQEALQERYDRALAAGYKALMLCSAIANAERIGGERKPEHIAAWELSGIQSPLDALVAEMPFAIRRSTVDDTIEFVSVEWSDDAAPRIAAHNSQRGCSLLPIEGQTSPVRTAWPAPAIAMPRQHQRENASAALSQTIFGGLNGAYGESTRTTAVIVSHDAEILGEAYAEGFGPTVPQRTWSVAKSIAATLVGAAVQRGDTRVDRAANLGLDTIMDLRSGITIDHALRMASGRYSDTAGARTDPLYYGGATVDEVAPDWPVLHAPGTVFRYANNDTLAAVQAIEHTFEGHPPSEFFGAVGMHRTVAETDWQGNYILSSQVWSTARDLARLGQLYLNNGVTQDGTRVLPENWLEYVSTPGGPQPDGPLGYGASWWLMNKSEGIPPDTIAALGNRGQVLVVVPSRDVVIVRRGEDPVGARFDVIAFTRDVLAALED